MGYQYMSVFMQKVIFLLTYVNLFVVKNFKVLKQKLSAILHKCLNIMFYIPEQM